MKPLSYIIYNTLYKPFLKWHLRSDVNTGMDGFKLTVLKGVFHPKLFFSTTYFYDYLSQLPLKDKTFLEIGSGSGLLSLLAARKEATVTAVDISEQAVKNTRLNFEKNFPEHNAVILQSDVFRNLPLQTFDVIVINPPYFFKTPAVESQHAWYCGSNGEYFEKLFSGMVSYVRPQSQVLMILADNCDIERIRSIAKRYNMTLELVASKKIKWENNFIFKIKQLDFSTIDKP